MVAMGLHLRQRLKVNSCRIRPLSYNKSKHNLKQFKRGSIQLHKLLSAVNIYLIILSLSRWDKRIKQELLRREKNMLTPQTLEEIFQAEKHECMKWPPNKAWERYKSQMSWRCALMGGKCVGERAGRMSGLQLNTSDLQESRNCKHALQSVHLFWV